MNSNSANALNGRSKSVDIEVERYYSRRE
jgi:hypothetical protein